MSLELFDILDIANKVLASVGVAFAINLFFSRRKAEKELYQHFYKHVLELEKLEEMRKLRNEIVHGKTPDVELVEEYMKVLNESILELKESEKKLVENAVSQPNKKGRYGFMAKFLEPLESRNG